MQSFFLQNTVRWSNMCVCCEVSRNICVFTVLNYNSRIFCVRQHQNLTFVFYPPNNYNNWIIQKNSLTRTMKDARKELSRFSVANFYQYEEFTFIWQGVCQGIRIFYLELILILINLYCNFTPDNFFYLNLYLQQV